MSKFVVVPTPSPGVGPGSRGPVLEQLNYDGLRAAMNIAPNGSAIEFDGRTLGIVVGGVLFLS